MKLVRHNEYKLLTLDKSTTQNCQESFHLVQGLPSSSVPNLRVLTFELLDDTCSAVLSLELYILAAKQDWECSKTFDS